MTTELQLALQHLAVIILNAVTSYILIRWHDGHKPRRRRTTRSRQDSDRHNI